MPKKTKEVTIKNGHKAMKGKCPDCGAGMYRWGETARENKRGL